MGWLVLYLSARVWDKCTLEKENVESLKALIQNVHHSIENNQAP